MLFAELINEITRVYTLSHYLSTIVLLCARQTSILVTKQRWSFEFDLCLFFHAIGTAKQLIIASVSAYKSLALLPARNSFILRQLIARLNFVGEAGLDCPG